jgi:maltooligosyltrehalose trehalohydrolase
VSHSDEELIDNVRKGRKSEFSTFDWASEIPDPQAESTFEASRLDHSRKQVEPHRTVLRFYKRLICFRREHFSTPNPDWQIQELNDRVLSATLGSGLGSHSFLFNFADQPAAIESLPQGNWRLRLDSSDTDWLGPGSSIPKLLSTHSPRSIILQPWSFAAFERDAES